jgi:hypothetical protein
MCVAVTDDQCMGKHVHWWNHELQASLVPFYADAVTYNNNIPKPSLGYIGMSVWAVLCTATPEPHALL